MGQGHPAIVTSPKGDITISQGAINRYGYRWSRRASKDDPKVPVEIVTDGWEIVAQIRARAGATPVWLTLSSAEDTALGSGIAVDDEGMIVVTITPAETEDNDWNAASRAEGVWDVEAHKDATDDDPREVVRIVMGTVTVSPDVTRIEDAT